MKAFDISLRDPLTGEELQPSGSVLVSITLMDERVDGDSRISVLHFPGPEYAEDLSDAAEVISSSISDGAVQFESSSFSVYVLVSYTVDFHSGDHRFSIAGSGTVLLSEVLSSLALSADLKGSSVDFTDLSLLSFDPVQDGEGEVVDWQITSLAAFSTVETLTVTLRSGAELVIVVTDEGEEAAIGESPYYTLADAAAAAGAGDTITLLKDVTLAEALSIYAVSDDAASITLDLGGHTLAGETLGVCTGDTHTGTITLTLQSGAVTCGLKAAQGGTIELGRNLTVTGDAAVEDGGSLTVSAGAEGSSILNPPAELVTGAHKVLTVTAESASKTYDGKALTKDQYTAEGFEEGDAVAGVTVTGSRTDVGSGENVPSAASVMNGEDDVTAGYFIIYRSGELTVDPAPVTLTAGSETVVYNSENAHVRVNVGYTCSVKGLTFSGITAYVSGGDTGYGMYDDTEFEGLTLNVTTDSTGNYVVTKTVNGLLTVTDGEPLVTKARTDFDGSSNYAHYKIVINPNGLPYNGGKPLTLKDTFSDNQSIDYTSISVEGSEEVSWDYSGCTGTFTVPDSTPVTITYDTRVNGSAGASVYIQNTAELGILREDGSFVRAGSASSSGSVTVQPDIAGSSGEYWIKLLVYPEDHMEKGLPGAKFRLLDENKRPMTYPLGNLLAGEEITFTTGNDGCAEIKLKQDRDGLTFRKNTVYYLEMVTAPYSLNGTEYTYYKKDNTYYSFVITDNPSYKYGSVYSFFNGDVLKVRCYPEMGGVNVMLRFSGNHELTEAQKNAITFTLQKEVMGSGSLWTDVESHTFGEFTYGSLTFDITRAELENGATYRMIETNGDPGLDGVELNTTWSVSYQRNGDPVEVNTNEFLVAPDDAQQYSYSFVFTNEYAEHKLTIYKLDEMKGSMLPGAEFTVYAADDPVAPVETYTTDAKGKLEISWTDTGAYATDTLYYAVETAAPEGYVLPAEPQKVYFYFSENGSGVLDGLPAGEKAIDLTTSYSSLTVPNSSASVTIPVTVTWGLDGKGAWPTGYSVVLGLYQSVDGAAPVPVLREGAAWTVTLNGSKTFDNTTFTGLPAMQTEGGTEKRITYSIKEERILNNSSEDVLAAYALNYSVSSTGWYVVQNQPGSSVTVNKEWYDQGGARIDNANTGDKPAVRFSLYRVGNDVALPELTNLTHEDLTQFLNSVGAVCARQGLVLNQGNGWTRTVPSLEMTDPSGNAYRYFALEELPANQIAVYDVVLATDSEPGRITIKNTQTKSTVKITAPNLEKTFGEADPAITLTAEVTELDGSASTVVITEMNANGSCQAVVTKENGDTVTISFSCSRAAGENVGTYTIDLTGGSDQEGYRVLLVDGTLKINRAAITVTAGGEKVYGDPDPAAHYTITRTDTGAPYELPEGSSIAVAAVREAGEDVGTYPITLTGEAEQGNFQVTLVESGIFTITPAEAVVTAEDKTKAYGADDPELTVSVTGLKNGDSSLVIDYAINRDSGENVGFYTITPSGEAEQGNYNVVFKTGKLTVTPAPLTVTVQDAEKEYGSPDPSWDVVLDGLQGTDSGDDIAYTIERTSGENVDVYTVTPSGTLVQGNYNVTYKTGELTIYPKELTVKAEDGAKAYRQGNPLPDPELTAEITGWGNGDENAYRRYSPVENGGTWTYYWIDNDTQAEIKVLEFTLTRTSGEVEGEYPISAVGSENQGNYNVAYEDGIFSILSMFNVAVSQTVEDAVDPAAAPDFGYRAEVDLAGTGLSDYNDNGFTHGVRDFTLPMPDGSEEPGANEITLKIPAGAKLTVTRNVFDADYDTAVTLDNADYDPTGDTVNCVVDKVDDYYAIRFIHTRITLPVLAMAAVDTTETGASAIDGGSGVIGIPAAGQTVNDLFADYQGQSGFVLPTDKYYAFDHASLYTAEGGLIASNIRWLRYHEHARWEYQTADGDGVYNFVQDTAQLRLFYMPQNVCQIETEDGPVQFYTLKAAVEYAKDNIPDATVEMLLEDYWLPGAVKVEEGQTVTVTTAAALTAAGKTAVIHRSAGFTSGHMLNNSGTLTLDHIVLDGGGFSAADATVLCAQNNAVLTVTENAALRNAKGVNGGAVYVAGGTVTISGALTGNTAAQGGAVYVRDGTVNITGEVTGNTATFGSAVYVAGGTVNVSGTVSGNTASSGGGLYVAGGTVNVSGTVSGNRGNTNGGAMYVTGGTVNITGAVTRNTAPSGGAVFMTGGTVNLSEGGEITENSATGSGGAFYIEGGAINMTGGTASNNGAGASGGLIYGTNGAVTISGGTVSGNTAEVYGGAVCYGGGGTVTVSGGVFTGNRAEKRGGAFYLSAGKLNLSGGTVGGEADGSANAAQNGSAVFVEDGTADFSGTVNITGNTATAAGGAVGIGKDTARLYFSGYTKITGNTMPAGEGTVASNVYLSVDSDLVINSKGLENKNGDSADIGIYIPAGLFGTRGDACCSFGTYTSNANVSKFKYDNGGLTAIAYEYKLMWSSPIEYYVGYMSSDTFQNKVLTAVSFDASKNLTQIQSRKTYYPHQRENQMYDLIKEWTPGYSNSNQLTNSVYAYSFAYINMTGNASKTQFSQFLTSIEWDTDNQRWVMKHNSENITYSTISTSSKRLYVYYSDPAYISITNNSEYPLTIDALTVMGKNAVVTNYGYPVVVDYRTVDTLTPIADLKLPGADPANPVSFVNDENKIVLQPGGYVKLLFPGACEKSWTLNGSFTDPNGDTAGTINYSLGDTPEQGTVAKGVAFSLDGTTLGKNLTYDILFGSANLICKVVDEDGHDCQRFSTLKEAWQYIQNNSMTTATIAMLKDYLQPGTDVLEIPEGYHITLTTAYTTDITERPEDWKYEGLPADFDFENTPEKNWPRATISRDNTNDGAAIIGDGKDDGVYSDSDSCKASLTVRDLNFDGKALAKAGNGGAISTNNFIVTIENCEFKGYLASRGGAIFVNWGKLTVKHTDFSDCYTQASQDKCGGSAIWTTAQVLEVEGCSFTDCACNAEGGSQGGAIFHNIRNDGAKIYQDCKDFPAACITYPTGFSAETETTLKNCTFVDCFSLSGSGGTVETDAWKVTAENCHFTGSYSGKPNGNGGAFNIYCNDSVNPGTINTSLTVKGCTFTDCSARRGSSKGGAIRTLTRTVTIENSTFEDCWAADGGAIYINDNSAISLTINGCTFTNCTATSGAGGAVYNPTKTLTIDADSGSHSLFENCTAVTAGGIYQSRENADSSVAVGNAESEPTKFINCVSTRSEGGALYLKAKGNITLTNAEFSGCTASSSGGGVWAVKGAPTISLTNCKFDHCVSGDCGGGARFAANTIKAEGVTVEDCQAVNAGGGLHLTPNKNYGETSADITKLTNCTFAGNAVTATGGMGGCLYIVQNSIVISGGSFTAGRAAYGGAIYNKAALWLKDDVAINDSIADISGGGLYTTATTNLNGAAFTGCKARTSGGGLYTTATTNLNGADFTDCYAVTSGGGIYHTNNLILNQGEISECCAGQGGGIYSMGYLKISNEAGEKIITGCKAVNVTIDGNGNATVPETSVDGNLGGGICKGSGSNWDILSGNAKIENCQAYDGGGIYYAVGGTLAISNGSKITGNKATHFGGGIYQSAGTINYSSGGGSFTKNEAEYGGAYYMAGGTSNLSTGTIGGSSLADANKAKYGAGVYVADGQSLTIGGAAITYNHAAEAGGGIAVGGSEAKLYFQNVVKVENNTMGSEGSKVDCNVYLDQNSNGVIRTTGTALAAGSYIGVYCSDEQDPVHGQPAQPFGTYNKTESLSCFHNDRRPFYYGVKGSRENQIVWITFVCKITDSAGNLLYKDSARTQPAVFVTLENNGGNGTDNAFGFVRDSVTLYTGTGTKITNDFQIQMLVQEYTTKSKIYLYNDRKITLTTASAEPDEKGFRYNGDPKHPHATVIKGKASDWMLENKGGDLTLTNIVLDGGAVVDPDTGDITGIKSTQKGAILILKSNMSTNPKYYGTATIGENAILRNGYCKERGGASYLQDPSVTLNITGGTIMNCQSEKEGGAIFIEQTGASVNMSGGVITGCTGTKGGAVYISNVASSLNMSGGAITGCKATQDGGGVFVNGINASLHFSGSAVIRGNTLSDGTTCNVQLDHKNIGIINAQGLTDDAEIGVYVSGANNGPNGNSSVFDNHGGEGDPFGTWERTESWNDEIDKPYCFINDRDLELRGSHGDPNDTTIYWARNYLLTVETAVTSDLAADREVSFKYKLGIEGAANKTYLTYHFNSRGEVTLNMKAGESVSVYLPPALQNQAYTVTLEYTDAQKEDFDPGAKKDGATTTVAEGNNYAVSGTLGENTNHTPPSGRSTVTYTHVRRTGSLTVSKTVIGKDDDTGSYSFTVTLGDTSITKQYGTVQFTDGVGTFSLLKGGSIQIPGLPTDLTYRVEETQVDGARTKYKQNGGEELTGRSVTGTIGERKDGDAYVSTVEFFNNYMQIVCKITDRNGNLLYYKESNDNLVEAVYDNLKEAFDRVNEGNLRKAGGGTASGPMRIEMVVPEYTLPVQCELSAGKLLTLSTAKTDPIDSKYPYTGTEAAKIYRGFTSDSMFETRGALTLDRITLDGKNIKSTGEGGIVKVSGNVQLTVNRDATLKNSITSGSGGAVWLGSNATLAMSGKIENCQATEGGGVYADSGFRTIGIYDGGAITGCQAVQNGENGGNGGGIYADSGSSVTVYAGAELTGNVAAQKGGALYSGTNVILRGTIGKADEADAGNTAAQGGGVYLAAGKSFVMYATGSVAGNHADQSGGGLYAENGAAVKIAGGNISSNTARSADNSTGSGGGAYVEPGATVTITGSPTISGNVAVKQGGALYIAAKPAAGVNTPGSVNMMSGTITENTALEGGAVYAGGSFTMSGGSMTKNATPADAAGKGGAVYVGGSFIMSGGSMTENTALDGSAVYVDGSFTMEGNSSITSNSSPTGAVSSGAEGVMTFSGKAKVSGNTFNDNGTSTARNVYLGYDNNGIIRTNGLDAQAYIGVYVAERLKDKHGLAAKTFGTYTGSNVSSAGLARFFNDRDTGLTGVDGGETGNGTNHWIMWNGKGLKLVVYQYGVYEEGKNKTAGGVTFTLTNTNNDADNLVESVQVWTGTSEGTTGTLTVPWGAVEEAGKNVAAFAEGSIYILRETSANPDTLRPGGKWKLTVSAGNEITWEIIPGDGRTNRTLDVKPFKADGTVITGKGHIGDTFAIYNDVKPVLTFDADGGKLNNAGKTATENVTIGFGKEETYTTYKISQKDPTKANAVFLGWGTSPNAEKDPAKLYHYGDLITWYRGTGETGTLEQVTEANKTTNYASGSLTLYAIWDEVVCKITDRDNNLLYVNGSPAVYRTLKDAFEDFNTLTFTDKNGSVKTQRKIQMLKSSYTLETGVTLERLQTLTLTTAPATDTEYAGTYVPGNPSTVCVITRGEECEGPMITNKLNLILSNIVLDGGSETIAADGGIISMTMDNTQLSIEAGAVLRNSSVSGNGGAVYAAAGAVTVTGGTISGSTASGSGGAIYSAGAVTVTGGTISSCTASGSGGAIYGTGAVSVTSTAISGCQAGSGSAIYGTDKVTVTGGTISGNTATGENGGAINVGENGTVTFGGSAVVYANTDADGNPRNMVLERDSNAVIFTASSVALTEDANIGVYVVGSESPEPAEPFKSHGMESKPFGTYSTDANLSAFKNDRAASLFGVKDTELAHHDGFIYWGTDGKDVYFKKTDGFGKALAGARFALYEEYACNTIRMLNVEGIEGPQEYVTSSGSFLEKNGVEYNVAFRVAPGLYYLKELNTNGNSWKYKTNTAVYRVIVGAAKAAELGVDLQGADYLIQRMTGETAADSTLNVALYGIMNESAASREVILRKEGGDGKPLEGAEFEILRADRTKVTVGGVTKFASGESGVFFIGELSYGEYYLHETNDGTASVDYYFVLTVDENGFRVGNRQTGSP